MKVSSVLQLKRLAKLKFKKEKFLKLSDAQEALAKDLKYRSWFHALKELNRAEDLRQEINAKVFQIVSNTKLPHLRKGEWCYYWCGEYDDDVDGQRLFIPSVVIKDQKGHYPLRGQEAQTPWYWGTTETEIQDGCLKMNQQQLGLTRSQILEIVVSTLG